MATTLINWETMTAEQAEALAAGMYAAQHESYVPPVTVGEPQPEEWPPVDFVPAMPKPDARFRIRDVFGEDGATECGDTPERL
jgi:DNA polymerase IIIc chi subunit